MSFTKENILTFSILAVFCFCALTHRSWSDEKMSSLRHLDDESNKTPAFMTGIDENEKHLLCQEFEKLALIQGSMMTLGIDNSHGLSEEEVENMMQECNFLKRKKRRTEEEKLANYEQFAIAAKNYDVIFPGTKWCGRGNIAYNDSDLGTQADTDRCCRTHDMCNDTILAGETGHGLTNNGQYTALSCMCDNELYDCLSNVDTFTSNTVGNLYFNILRSQCFKNDYPQTDKCKTYALPFHFICVEYEKDTTKPKVYQWFPGKVYKNLPISEEIEHPESDF